MSIKDITTPLSTQHNKIHAKSYKINYLNKAKKIKLKRKKLTNRVFSIEENFKNADIYV